jgi:hypothetical protein
MLWLQDGKIVIDADEVIECIDCPCSDPAPCSASDCCYNVAIPPTLYMTFSGCSCFDGITVPLLFYRWIDNPSFNSCGIQWCAGGSMSPPEPYTPFPVCGGDGSISDYITGVVYTCLRNTVTNTYTKTMAWTTAFGGPCAGSNFGPFVSSFTCDPYYATGTISPYSGCSCGNYSFIITE